MDFETKEMLRVVGRLITDLSPGSIQDLGRKTEALSILRGIVQAEERPAEPAYPLAVVEAWERVHNVLAGVTDKGVSALDIMAELYAIGQKEGAAREYYRDANKAQAAEKDVCRTQEIPPSTKPRIDDAAAYSILGARAAGGLRASREHVDDIEFFRNGGI